MLKKRNKPARRRPVLKDPFRREPEIAATLISGFIAVTASIFLRLELEKETMRLELGGGSDRKDRRFHLSTALLVRPSALRVPMGFMDSGS